MSQAKQGIFTCLDCDKSITAKTAEEAIAKFDHAIALTKNRTCPNNPRNHRWNGLPIPGYHPDLPKMEAKKTKS